jgi:hypothetical protein
MLSAVTWSGITMDFATFSSGALIWEGCGDASLGLLILL